MPGPTHIGKILFLDSLNDFLPESDRQKWLELSFELSPSVKDAIEAHGVPHVEVFGIRINGEWKPFGYNLNHGDEIRVYPKESIPEPSWEFALKPPEGMPGRFVADVHLGKLARLLRLVGIDTLYDNTLKDREIVKLAEQEGRAVLSRDVGLLKHGALNFGYWLRSTDPDRQVIETLSYFDLKNRLKPFNRCLACNGLLERADPKEVENEVPEGVKSWSKQYRRCSACGKIYWKGSHYEELRRTVRSIRARLEEEKPG